MKRRVLLLTGAMRHGGSQRFVSLVLEHLDRELFAPELATVYDSDSEYLIPADVTVHRISAERGTEMPVPLDLPADIIAAHANEAASVQSIVDRIAHLVCRTTPDVILCAPEWASALAAAASPGFPAGTRVVCRVGALLSFGFPPSGNTRFFSLLLGTSLNKADCVVANSRAIAHDMIQSFGVDEHRVVVLRNPLDIGRVQLLARERADETAYDDGVPVVAFTGRLERVKGLEYLLRALSRVTETMRVQCVLVGEGSQRGYLRALAKHLGIERSVHFVGQQSNPFKFMSQAEVFVLPSLSEGMPNVLLEAMACGCAVIASDIEGGVTREVLEDGACGVIVERANAESLANALLEVLRDEGLRLKLQRAGLERACEYDLARTMPEVQNLLLSVASAAIDSTLSPAVTADSRDREPDQNDSALVTTAPAQPEAEHRAPVDRIQLWGGRIARLFSPSWWRSLAKHRSTAEEDRRELPAVPIAPTVTRREGRELLMVLVPSLTDESLGAGTDVLLKQLDRAVFDVCLVRIFDVPDDTPVPYDVETFVIDTNAAFQCDDPRAMPLACGVDELQEFRWMSARARALVELSSALKPDAILAQGYYAAIVATMAHAELTTQTRVIAGIHTPATRFIGPAGPVDLYGTLVCAYLGNADAVFAPNDEIGCGLEELIGLSPSQVSVIPDPIEIDSTVGESDLAGRAIGLAQAGARVFVCDVCGSAPRSRAVLEALVLALTKEDVRCALLGLGSGLSEVAAMADELGLSHHVSLMSDTSDFDSLAMIGSAYIEMGCDTSGRVPETMVRSVIANCPVIAVGPSAAVAEFLNGGTRGLVVLAGDSPALAEAMLQVAWDEAAVIEMTSLARRHLDLVSAQVIVPRVEALVGASSPKG